MPRIDNELKLSFKDVLIRPKRSNLKSRSQVDLVRPYTFKHSKRTLTSIPIIAANMDTVGTFEMAVALAEHIMLVAIHKWYTIEEWDNFVSKHPKVLSNIAISSGTSEDDFKKITTILTKYKEIVNICLDIANGYSEHFVEYVKRVRRSFPTHTIIAGNVVTGEMVEALVFAGADIIKIGIGPGSVCTTRKKTGIGYPQISAVIECADAAHGLGAHVISDGGCKTPGDVAKAFGAGADFVMIGGMLSGHDESAGKIIEKNGKKVKEFYGMSSKRAMVKHVGKVANYRSSEGKVVQVPYRGSVHSTCLDILGGLRSCCTYVGADKLKSLSKRTTFIRVNIQTNEVFAKYE